jgi:dTDP-glucose 4,6-dehydratase/UDP-glucose 4-epimerase
MKILVVGSKGFIGTHLFNYYSTKSEVWGCDVLMDYDAVNYFLVDASNADFDDLFQSIAFEVCINCSGAASVPDSVKNPQRDFYLNTLNVFNLLDSIRKHQPKCKFINLSSAAVYGNPSNLPIIENAELKPLSPYGFHKKNAEMICEEFSKFYGIKTCSLRIFSAYGNGLKKQLFWDIAQKAKHVNSLTLYGTGLESRDFIHVNDLIQAIDNVIKIGDFNAGIYNVANGEEITIKQAADIILKGIGWQGVLSFNNETRIGDPLNWCADISKLKSLGYKQRVTLTEGLNDYAKWLKD